MPIIQIPSRGEAVNFPDSMSQEEISAALARLYPKNDADVLFQAEQAKQDAISGKSSVNPIDAMSLDDYAAYRREMDKKDMSLGDFMGVAKDSFEQVYNDIVGGVEKGAMALGEGKGGVMDSAYQGLIAGTVGLVDLGSRILQPAKKIPSKEEFLRSKYSTQPGFTPFGYPLVSGQSAQNTEDDYRKLIETEKQRDSEAFSRLMAMEKLIKEAPVPEVAAAATNIDPTILTGLGSFAVKAAASGVKSLFKGGARKALTAAAEQVGQEAAQQTIEGGTMRPVRNAVLSGIEKAGSAVQIAGGLPGQITQGVKNLAERVMPGTGAPLMAAGMATGLMTDAGLTATIVGGLKTAEKVGEITSAVAREAMDLPSRTGKLERVAVDPNVSRSARRLAASLAQVQPIGRYLYGTAKQGLKEAAIGGALGAGLGYLADGEEGAAAGLGAGAAFGTIGGAFKNTWDTSKEVLGYSTERTRRNAIGDVNRFIAEEANLDQPGWTETFQKLVKEVGPEKAADTVDAIKIARGLGAEVRLATRAEQARWDAPGWMIPGENNGRTQVILNPERINPATAAHETTHVQFNNVITSQFKNEVTNLLVGQVDPVTGKVVTPGKFDSITLAKIADQIADAYGEANKGKRKEFRKIAGQLRFGTEPQNINAARMQLVDEIVAHYGQGLFDRSRPGRFNPDRLPLVYRNLLNSVRDTIVDTFRTTLYKEGNILNLNDIAKGIKDSSGKPVRIKELDTLMRKAFDRQTKIVDENTAPIDRIPVNKADRAIWQQTYGGLAGIMNQDGSAKSIDEINKEARERTRDTIERLQTLPEADRVGLEVTTDAKGNKTLTAKGQISEAAINQILSSDKFDTASKTFLREAFAAIQDPKKRVIDTRYFGVYTRGKGSYKMVAGVKASSQNQILPYAIVFNSKDGVIVRGINMSKVKDNLAKTMSKPEFKNLYKFYDEAYKDLNIYLDNLTSERPIESSVALGGGKNGDRKRNFFYDVMDFRLGNEDSLVNAPETVSRGKSNAIKSYRIERFTKFTPTNEQLSFEEGTTYKRIKANFMPDSFYSERLPGGTSLRNDAGYKILKNAAGKLFRIYDPSGKEIGIASSQDVAIKKARDSFLKSEKAENDLFKRMRFQYAGESAELTQFSRDSLDTAKAMAKEGKDSETIRAITGWFLGKYDGKMRWEIPDNEVTIRLPEYRSLRSNGEDARTIVSSFVYNLQKQRFSDALERVQGLDAKSLLAESKRIQTLTDQENIRLRDFYAGEENPNRINNRVPLFYLLDHPQLFEAYPDAAWIPVGFSAADVDPFADAQFNRSSNVIGINPLMVTDDSIVSTVLHEVQHWIQKREGFAKGSHYDAESPYNFDDLESENKKYASALRKLIQEHEAKGGSAKTALNSEYGKVLSNSLTLIQDAIKKAKEGYKRSAGEIEARDVEARQSFTPEQRKAIAPYSSENIAKDEAIVRFQPPQLKSEKLPDGEVWNASKGFKILKTASSKMFRVYANTGREIGVAKTLEAASKIIEKKLKPKKTKREEKTPSVMIDQGDLVTLPLYQLTKNGKPKFKDGKPEIEKVPYKLVEADFVQNYKGTPEDATPMDFTSLSYDVTIPYQKKINKAIENGAVDSIANKIVEQTVDALKIPEIAAGKGWYSRMREYLLDALGEHGREVLSQLLGATSAKTPVTQNFLQAMDAYEGLNNGRYNLNRKNYLEMLSLQERGELDKAIEQRGYRQILQEKLNLLNKKFGNFKSEKGFKREEFKASLSLAQKLKSLINSREGFRPEAVQRDIMIYATDMVPMRSNGKKFNANSMAVLKVIAGTWLDNRSAPKTPNFAGNLTGRTLQATIDVWAARFLRRMIYDGNNAPWRIAAKAEEAVNNGDFAFGQLLMERAARKLGMNPDDLQAVLWFAEKDLWDKNGWTGEEGADKTSFDEMFHLFFPKGRKPLTFEEASNELIKQNKQLDTEKEYHEQSED